MFITSTVIIFLILIMKNVAVGLPNIVLILTDDQDLLLNGLMSMKKTHQLLANEGKLLLNAYVNTPVCCPSRSTILTGKYPHNTGVVNNSISGGCSSKTWQDDFEHSTVPAILQKEKRYVTFYAGKYLNQYGTKEAGGVEHVPPGYDWWVGLKGNSRYYNYTLSVNGTANFYGDSYLTDVLMNFSLDFLEKRPRERPFFMIISTPAPHAPFTPAERHQNVFSGVKALRTKSFNFTSNQKHWLVNMSPRHLPQNVSILDKVQQHRLESLLAVDDMVENIINKLHKDDLLRNTYVILTSDNGFHIGQFTQPWDKRQPYETDIKVPFLIRGPGIPRKTVETYPMSAVDIMPTILDLANVEVPANLDGESIKRHLFSTMEEVFRKTILVEYWGEASPTTIDPECHLEYDGNNLAECSADQWCKCQDSRNNTYSCLVEISNTSSLKFCRFQDNLDYIESYDLTSDPYELHNIAPSLTQENVLKYGDILNKAKICSGRRCRIEQLGVSS